MLVQKFIDRIVSGSHFSQLTFTSFGLAGSLALVASFTFAALGSLEPFATSFG